MVASKTSRTIGQPVHHRHGISHFSDDIIKFELDKGLLDCLVSWLILSIDDADKIRQTPVQTSRNILLLNILKERPYNTFSILIEALKASDPIHHDLANEMKSFAVEDQQVDVNLREKSVQIDDFYVRFQKSYKTLVNGITLPMEIADVLFELKTFNIEDCEDISSQNTLFEKNRKLMKKIYHKGRLGYETFLKALRQSNDSWNQKLAEEIERTEISPDDKILLQIGTVLSQRNENIRPNVREIAGNLEDHWIEEDAAFVETKGCTKLLKMVKENDCITIVGSSGTGKTALMRHAGLSLKYKELFQAIPVDLPDKIIEYRDEKVKQIFLIDDVLGKYSINPLLVDKWDKLGKTIQHYLNAKPGKIKLLFTLRKQVKNNRKFNSCPSIITKNIFDLEDDEIALSKEEKRQMLIKHLKENDMESSITEHDVERACASHYAFPLICKIVSTNEERLSNIAKFFREPCSVIQLELEELWNDNKEVYCALVFCMLSNGKIDRDFFAVLLPKSEKFDVVTEACGLHTNISRKVIEDSLTYTIGTYVYSENGTFRFIHDAFLESTSFHFAKMNPDIMFSYCNIDLIRDRVRINSKLLEDDENVIVICRDQFNVIAKRLLYECEEGRFSNVLLSHVIKDKQFVECLGKQLKDKNQVTTGKLIKIVSKERRNKNLLELFREMWHSSNAKDKNKKTVVENNAAIEAVILAPPRQSTFIHWILASGCYTLFIYIWENISKKEKKDVLSKDLLFPLTQMSFPLAVLSGNVHMIRILHSCGVDVNCFSNEGETPLSITARSGRHDITSLLIDWGANVNQPDMLSHRRPSFIALQNNNDDVLKILLKHNCDVNLVDINGKSSTMLQALLTRKRKIVDLLIEFDSSEHPVHVAVLNCDVNYLKCSLENNDINSRTKNGFTPLHYATLVNGISMIRLLLGYNEDISVNNEQLEWRVNDSPKQALIRSVVADINSKNKNGLTPLHLAVLNDHIEAVKLLIERNADINIEDHFGRIPLHYSQISVISSLLLNQETQVSVFKIPSLSCCVAKENHSDVVVLVDGNIETQRMTISCSTFIWNVALNFLPFNRYLQRGNINLPDNHGNTPLHVMIENHLMSLETLDNKNNYDNRNNVKLLLNHGANVYHRNDEGYLPSDLIGERNDVADLFTPFMSKTSRNQDEVIRKLLVMFSIFLCYTLALSPLIWALTSMNIISLMICPTQNKQMSIS